MALPKRRFSRARRDKRRSQQRLAVPTLTACPQCGAQMAAHHACPACGTYRGKQVLQTAQQVTGDK